MDDERRKLIDEVTRKLTDEGKLIEVGWQSFHLMALSNASEHQLHDMRIAFFTGAQHLWGAMMSILSPGDEATEGDVSRLDLIDKELTEFIIEFKQSTLTKGPMQ
jgi:aryl carrier-like protein